MVEIEKFNSSSCSQNKQHQLSSPFLITLPFATKFATRFPTSPSSFNFSFPLDQFSFVKTKPGDLKFPKCKNNNKLLTISLDLFYTCFCYTLDFVDHYNYVLGALHSHLPSFSVLSTSTMRVVEGGLQHGSQTEERSITDHGYKNFIFPNHKNKPVRYSLYYTVLRKQKITENRVVKS